MRSGLPEQLTRGPSQHTEELSRYIRTPYTEDQPYYLFQHDLLERMPKIKELSKPAPKIPDFMGRHIISIGKDGAGLPLHEHAQTWSELLIGRKRWSIYHPVQHPMPPSGFSPMGQSGFSGNRFEAHAKP